MKIKFCGAAGEVTGSQHLIEVNGKKILLDCGMFQGRRKKADAKNRKFLFDPKKIDAVILSHAHIDHSGRLPLLAKGGFDGPVYSTFATRDLCNYMLLDGAYIQEKDAEYYNRKKRKKGEAPIEPLYTEEDAREILTRFVGVSYERCFVVTDGVVGCFYDAGHILGSAIVHLIIYDKKTKKHIKFGFTGDLGRKNIPILQDPVVMPESDVLITETTYGNRLHKSVLDIEDKFAEIVNEVAKRNGKIIIPAFSLERTQEIVYYLNVLWKNKRIPEIPIFVDSPLSGNVTEVFKSHPECFDEETYREFLDNNENPFGFGKLKYTHSVDESKALNNLKTPAIIISASGMCEYGRILHHLKNNIEDKRNAVLIVGYQAEHTLGRK
ncbi:MBL fold metallo-hydrolase, partial [Patescibacteria group bacterium]|nr:MBL fold metallo-hydrolase [Patescibacteria group bacterium]